MFPVVDLGYEPDDLMVKVSHMMVATADESDAEIDTAVLEVLRLLREKMHMDVVFVSEFADGQRIFRAVDTAPDHAVVAVGQGGVLVPKGGGRAHAALHSRCIERTHLSGA